MMLAVMRSQNYGFGCFALYTRDDADAFLTQDCALPIGIPVTLAVARAVSPCWCLNSGDNAAHGMA